MDLNQAVQHLAQARKELEQLDGEAGYCLACLQATGQWEDLNEAKVKKAAKQDEVAELETALRNLAVESYDEDGNKHPHPAIGVKEFTHLDYSPAMAKEYCLEHRIQAALKLDAKAFEKLAPGLDLGFVDTVKEFRATIATDLSEWVA